LPSSRYNKLMNSKQRRPVVNDFESLVKKTGLPSTSPALGMSEKSKPLETDRLAQLKARDQALSKKLISEMEKEIEEHRRLRQAKKEEEAKEAQILAEQQQQQQDQPKRGTPPSSRPKRGGAFLGLGKKKATEARVKQTRQEAIGSKGGG